MVAESRAPSPLLRSSPWLLLPAFWMAAIRVFGPEWTVNPHYHFGWIVPLLCAAAFLERWRSRPEPETAGSGPRRLGRVLGALILVWMPVRLVLEAFPDWRPGLWAVGGLLVGLTLGLLEAAGGRRWLRHFLFPVAFFLTAIPWPTLVERPVLQGLLHLNTSIVANALTLVGEPVVPRGNLIETARGVVGLDEACSGMRSLQAAIMIALFIGEWFRLRPARRGLLLVVGVLVAFITNTGRALVLTAMAARGGNAAAALGHDPAGVVTMAVCVAALWAFAWRWRTPAPSRPTTRRAARALPSGVALALAGGLLVAEAGTEGWYRWRERSARPAPSCTIVWPETRERFRMLGILPEARRVLRIDDGAAAAWRAPGGGDWFVHRLRWEPRPSSEAILAKYHTPDVCLPATGCLLRADSGTVNLDVDGHPLQWRRYVFEEDGRPVFVFHLLREDRTLGREEAIRSLPVERLRLVWEGKRRTGQTALHVAVRGLPDEAAALAGLREEIAPLLRVR